MKIKGIQPGLILLLIAHSVFAQSMNIKQSELRSEEHARGRIRSIRTEMAYLEERQGEWVELQRVLLHITTYDHQGNRIEIRTFDQGEVSQTIIPVHDAQGRKTEEREYGTDHVFHLRRTYTAYSQPHSIEALTYEATGNLLPGKEIYLYQADGKLRKLIQDNGKADVMMPNPIWIVFDYDAKGRPVQAIYCSGNAKSRSNDMGLPDKTTPCGSGKLISKNIFFYDEKGHLIREAINSINSYVTMVRTKMR